MADANRARTWYRNPFIIVPAIVVILAAVITVFLTDIISEKDRDFRISVKPMQGQVELGGNIQTTVTITGINNYEHAVSLSASQQPSNMVVTFVPPIGGPEPAYTSTMMLNMASNVDAGRYSIIVKGTGADGTEHTCTYNLIAIKPTPTPTPTPLPTPTPTPAPAPTPVPITYALNLSIDPSGSGSVTLSPSGGTYNSGTTVRLTATPAAGYQFDRWSGDASGESSSIEVTISADKTVIANFIPEVVDEGTMYIDDMFHYSLQSYHQCTLMI